MQLLARAGKCGGRGASGLVYAPGWVAPACRVKNPSSCSRAVSATPAKPAAICQRNSRRVPVQPQLEGRLGWVMMLLGWDSFLSILARAKGICKSASAKTSRCSHLHGSRRVETTYFVQAGRCLEGFE